MKKFVYNFSLDVLQFIFYIIECLFFIDNNDNSGKSFRIKEF